MLLAQPELPRSMRVTPATALNWIETATELLASNPNVAAMEWDGWNVGAP
jgi:hypothetical protein